MCSYMHGSVVWAHTLIESGFLRWCIQRSLLGTSTTLLAQELRRDHASISVFVGSITNVIRHLEGDKLVFLQRGLSFQPR